MEADEETKVASSASPHGGARVGDGDGDGRVDGLADAARTTVLSDQNGILKALQVIEKDSFAIAESYTSLFTSLRLALSEITGSSADHMQCFVDAAGRVQECALDAATKGNRHINSCLRLNEEMKGIDPLANQLKVLKRNVDVLDSAVNKLLRLP
ncbi:uncharacterized protein LOC124946178 [Impatiens glandulifera]|uniref:uncharacterized protein LOC124946178 n=1 Tax=Impatiens glandulifera TaxID=253017 RepID=UPI001FB100A2|nr:uncharacterized protein LOC124946178 [Impatiens glandulifera]